MRRSFLQDHGAGTHDGLLTDHSPRQHDGTDSDVRQGPDRHTAAEYNARRNMSVRADSAIVFDDGSAVHNAIFADDRAGVNDDSGHHDCSSSDPCGRSDNGSWMNKSRRRESAFQCVTKTPGASAIITYSDEESASGKVMEFVGSAYDRAAAEGQAGLREIIIDEDNGVETSGSPHDVQNDFRVPAGTPNQ